MSPLGKTRTVSSQGKTTINRPGKSIINDKSCNYHLFKIPRVNQNSLSYWEFRHPPSRLNSPS